MSQHIVEQVKAELEAHGVDLSGPCGAFSITQRVAWRLRHDGWGLLGGKSEAQNGCTVGNERYSVDFIMKPNGEARDVLIDAGVTNRPSWQAQQAAPSLYRPALDPDDGTSPPPPPPQPPPPPPIEPLPPEASIDAKLNAILHQLVEVRLQLSQISARQDRPLRP